MSLKIPNYGGDDRRGYHPPACTCFACNEERLQREANEEDARRAAEYDRRVRLAKDRAAKEPPASDAPPSSNAPPAGTPATSSAPAPGVDQPAASHPAASVRVTGSPESSQPSSPPPPRQPPNAPFGSGQSRPRDEQNGPLAILRRWLLLITVVLGVVLAILYFTNSGPFSPPGGEGPVAVAAPDPTGNAPLDEPLSTPIPTRTVSMPPALLPIRASDPTVEPPPSPTVQVPAPYGGWTLDCPGCPVAFLDREGPETIGVSRLRAGDRVRIVGCTNLQTSLHRQFVFSTPGREHTGLVLFGLRYPLVSASAKCLEMVGEYLGRAEYSMDTRSVFNPIVVPTRDSRRWDWAQMGTTGITEKVQGH